MGEEQTWRAVTGVVIVASLIVGGWAGMAGRPDNSGSSDLQAIDAPELAVGDRTAETVQETVASTDLPGSVTIHVAGWVERPGIFVLPTGARIADAIVAAGGARPGALLTMINLAEPLNDGLQIVVPGPDSGGASAPTGVRSSDGRVRVNQADAAELETLPGVGPVLAERIVGHRDDHGPFEAVEDLLDVSGIGESKLASIRDHVIVP